jgi:hypothetical protein
MQIYHVTKPPGALEVGDVFTCEKFAHCHPRNSGDSVLTPGAGGIVHYTHRETRIMDGEEWTCEANRTRSDDRSDPERGKARFEVIDAGYGGGGYGHGEHDVYPDGWQVLARRLDGPAELIEFYQSGAFRNLITPDDTHILPR